MDFTHAFYAGQPFQQQFIAIPPLTPSHSNSAASDEYTRSPPEVFTEFPADPFQSFDYASQFAPQQPVFPGPPTPPDHQIPALGRAGRAGRAGPRPSHAPPPAQQSAARSQLPPAASASAAAPAATAPLVSSAMAIDSLPADLMGFAKTEPGADDYVALQAQQDQGRPGGSNSDDDEMTPAQSRRKAQNRAAQRAFRERKERHVKDLEAKLASLEAAQQKTATENERLRQDLQKVSTENEILRATSSIHAAATGLEEAAARAAPLTTGPMTYNPTDFYTELLAHHDNKSPSHRIATSEAGERLLAAGATWDLIISHDLFRRGLVDVAEISNRLKHQAKCDGQGPVFEERAILAAIEQSVGSGSDSLV